MSEMTEKEKERTANEHEARGEETSQAGARHDDRPDRDGRDQVAVTETAGDSVDDSAGETTEQHGSSGSRDAFTERDDGDDETAILRQELQALRSQLDEARAQANDFRDRFLRARAELENYRRRAAGEADRARDAGLDSALLPVLSVYDDLNRALEAAETADPSQIVPGVRSVLTTLERNLEALGVESVGSKGDRFDPDLHEALTTVPAEDAEKAETIAEVFQAGFRKGERLIRPARVVVYQN